MRRCLLLSIILCALFVLSMFGWVHSKESQVSVSGVLFLTIVNFPRANAMGDCVINLVDEEAALYNPGILGLFHLNKILGVSFPNNTKWLPELAEDVQVNSYSVSGGLSSKLLWKNWKSKLTFSLALAYSNLKIDYGTIACTNESSNVVSYFNPVEKADNYTIGAGVEYYVRLGIGYTYKKINSRLGPSRRSGTGEANAYDLGVMAEFPLFDIIQYQIPLDQSNKYFMKFALTPSVAYVRANKGDDIYYINVAQSDPLPKMSRTGISVNGAVKIKNSTLACFTLTKETQKDLVGKSFKVKKNGYEFGLLGVFYVRGGRFKDDPPDRNVKTSGYGISLNGLVSWLFTLDRIHIKNDLLEHIVKSLDVSYDQAKYSGDVLSNTKFVKWGFSF